MATGILKKAGLIEIGSGKGKLIQLTKRGAMMKREGSALSRNIEQRWQERFGRETMQRLRQSLGRIVGDAEDQTTLLFQGVQPYSDGWRARIPAPQTLPHFPMVLHRGGFPDGS